MELIESDKEHAAVAHKGSAAGPRRNTRAGGFAVLTAYMSLRDLSEATGIQYTEGAHHTAVFCDNIEESSFVVQDTNLFYSARMLYIDGDRCGDEVAIDRGEYKRLLKIYHDPWGEVIYGPFGWIKFKPGTEQQTLPIFQYGSGYYLREGYVDEEGTHWGEWYEPSVW